MAFQRFLDDRFISALNDLYADRTSWWASLVDSPDVFMAIRNNYLNAYSNGMSIGKIAWKNSRVGLEVHEEYLLTRPNQPLYIDLLADAPPRSRTVVSSGSDYARDLNNIKRRAGRFAGEERKGTNQVACKLLTVLDMEAAYDEKPEKEPDPLSEEEMIAAGRGRIDLVVLGPNQSLTFFEAKLYSNGELRAKGIPKVCNQLNRYHAFLKRQSHEVNVAYNTVLSYFDRLHGKFFEKRNVHSIIKDAIKDSTRLAVDHVPRLFIFGIGELQKRGLSQDKKRILEGVQVPGFDERKHIRSISEPTSVKEHQLT